MNEQNIKPAFYFHINSSHAWTTVFSCINCFLWQWKFGYDTIYFCSLCTALLQEVLQHWLCLMLSGYRKRSSNISMCSLIGTPPSLVVTLTMDYYLSKETTGDLPENCYHQYLPLASWNRCSSKTGLDWLLLIWNRIPFKIILTWLYQRS